jgi:chemotaxis protein methyltransferase CheR
MQDAECLELLRWALPRLGLRWPGFHKGAGAAAHRQHLERVREESPVLDSLCEITISRSSIPKAAPLTRLVCARTH